MKRGGIQMASYFVICFLWGTYFFAQAPFYFSLKNEYIFFMKLKIQEYTKYIL